MRLVFERVRGETEYKDALVNDEDLGELDPAALFERFFEERAERPLTELEREIVADAAKAATDAYNIDVDSDPEELENSIVKRSIDGYVTVCSDDGSSRGGA